MVRDSLFLAALGLLGSILYTEGLGFYGDDWGFLAILESADDRSLFGLFHDLYRDDVVIRQRPVQVLYLSGLYFAFGLQPLGYHVVNAVLLAAVVVLFYALLRTLHVRRTPAVAVACVYAVMPNFSTDRFWIAAHQASVSTLFLLLSALAGLKSLQARPVPAIALVATSVSATVLSGLAYEVTLPLLLVLVGVAAHRARVLGRLERPPRQWIARALIFGNAVALGVVMVFKALTTVRVGVQQSYFSYLRDLVAGIVQVDIGVYGVGLPYVTAWILRYSLDGRTLAYASVAGVVVAAYVARLPISDCEPANAARRLVFGGLATMAAGYVVFLVPTAVSLSSASLGNRIRIAAALGVAAAMIGSLLYAVSAFRRRQLRHLVFAAAVGLVCGVGFLVTNTLAQYWVSAYDEQMRLVANLQADIPTLDPGSTVIIGGVCFERGGAYVFTGQRDVTGILTILYRSRGLHGSAVTDSVEVRSTGLVVPTYGSPDIYAYGSGLLFYDARKRTHHRLGSHRAAETYFHRSAFDPRRECPPGFAWRAPPSS